MKKKLKKKILFIENKVGVFYWDRISKYLNDKYEIHWIIQNHFYIPKSGIKHIIKYPQLKDLIKINNNNNNGYKKIISADRGHNYYGQKTDHYIYYYKQIRRMISKIKPSLIIGEATLFHELIAIKIAKELKIRFIFPSNSRYLSGRTSFYKYDTSNYILNKSKDSLISDIKLNKLIYSIRNNNYKNDYLFENSFSFYIKLFGIKLIAFFAYLNGEKYNTHSPYLYAKLSFLRKFNFYLWTFYTHKNKKNLDYLLKKKTLLFPLQLQPETSINVWGYPHANQIKIIKELSRKLKKIGYFLAVKPNPKFKYEVNFKSFSEIRKLSNVILIPPKTKMSYLLKRCEAIFSITGTIILESIIHNKNIFTLHKSDFTNHKGITKVESLSHLIKKLVNLKNKKTKRNNSNARKMLKKIFKHSFPYPLNLWRVQEFYSNPDLLIAETITQIEKTEKF